MLLCAAGVGVFVEITQLVASVVTVTCTVQLQSPQGLASPGPTLSHGILHTLFFCWSVFLDYGPGEDTEFDRQQALSPFWGYFQALISQDLRE